IDSRASESGRWALPTVGSAFVVRSTAGSSREIGTRMRVATGCMQPGRTASAGRAPSSSMDHALVAGSTVALTLIAVDEGLVLLWIVDPHAVSWLEQVEASLRLILACMPVGR